MSQNRSPKNSAASASARPKGRVRSTKRERSTARNEVRVQTVKHHLKWSFGGLTVSARLLATLLIVVLALVILVPTLYQWIAQEQRYRDILAEVEEIRQYNQQLEEDLQAWEDEEYVAQQARSRLGYVRPGETQYSVIGEDGEMLSSSSTSGTATADDSPTKPWTQLLTESILDADDPEGEAAAELQKQREAEWASKLAAQQQANQTPSGTNEDEGNTEDTSDSSNDSSSSTSGSSE